MSQFQVAIIVDPALIKVAEHWELLIDVAGHCSCIARFKLGYAKNSSCFADLLKHVGCGKLALEWYCGVIETRWWAWLLASRVFTDSWASTAISRAFDPAWETRGMQHYVTVNKLGLDMVTSLNASSTKLVKSFGIIGGEVEAVYNNDSLKQLSFTDVVNGTTNQATAQKAVGGVKNYADLARGIGIPLKIDISTLVGKFGHYVRVFVNVDLAGVGHSMTECKSLIGKESPKDRAHANKKENKAPSLNQVYKPKVDVNIEMGIKVRPSASDLSGAHSRTDFNTEVDDEIDDYENDRVEDKWPPLKVEGSSKPSKEIDGFLSTGQQSNAMVMVPLPIDSLDDRVKDE
ncbi:hypothetical protein FNV43_RR12487 [Rhamnella rubrinervis]|uniref:Uncharacterized protein n=1 Tax=Rhamnella rubrinervis TaxID=2594499 RepID=A0A8K0MIB5_9ROSA|nr:hypothetical protein FNV43_RR12487 [Rhamnella rubrinervis]